MSKNVEELNKIHNMMVNCSNLSKMFSIEDYDDISMEKALTAKKRNSLPDNSFGIPEDRSYPLYDKDGNPDYNHIKSAISLFHHCPKNKRSKLAKRILRAINEYNRTHKNKEININKDAEWYKYTK